MSEMDMDRLPRLKETTTAEQLDTEACVTLASEVTRGAADDLTCAARQAAALPDEKNMRHLEECRRFYESDLFTALSCGLVNGAEAAQAIIKDALRGRKIGGELL